MFDLNHVHQIEKLGLQDEMLLVRRSDAAARNRFIATKDELVQLPSSLWQAAAHRPPFSRSLLAIAKDEFFRPQLDLNDFESSVDLDSQLKSLVNKPSNERLNDITIDQFIRRRFDDSMADYLFDPLCRGITSGDSRSLSVRSMFAAIFDAERRSGSVVKGMLKDTFLPSKSEAEPTQLLRKLKENKATLWSLRNGMSQLTDTMQTFLNESGKQDGLVQLNLNCQVNAIKFREDGSSVVKVKSTNESEVEIEASHVFSTIPSFALSDLLSGNESLNDLKCWLNSIKFASVAVINLEFAESDLLCKYPGFGFLIPSFVDRSFLGIAFDSVVFPEHNGPNKTTRISVSSTS
jgi:oxygen-dependent protoporphyrinogen oxidase